MYVFHVTAFAHDILASHIFAAPRASSHYARELGSVARGNEREIEELVPRKLMRRAEESKSGAFFCPFLQAISSSFLELGVSNWLGGNNHREEDLGNLLASCPSRLSLSYGTRPQRA
ncbi:hypothetical protein EIP91_003653 [Steccherinum ochraceum]|uniref:Uncharacterized protein n=1 Tax=Steccherinum ochraceum TaxID=92696 RepID=A0A4R0RBJ9_9APHY|nr:hypothetical protein EIP91_003653 [Steccherinum ochraceum]